MNNTLRDRILAERITELSQLSDAEQVQVQADAGLRELLAENRALASMLATDVQAPQRGPMLAAAVREGRESDKEHRMTIFQRMFAGRSPLAQAGLAVMLMAVFSAAYMGFMAFSSKPAWSMTTGSVLEYTLQGVSHEDDLQPLLDTYIAKVKEAKLELYGDASTEKKTVQISVNIDAHRDGPDAEEIKVASLVISLTEDDPELLAMIQQKVAEIPGAPVANVRDAVWFFGPEGPGQGGMRFEVDGKLFNFPPDATAEQVESQIREWLAQEKPGEDWVVDITIERDQDGEGRERVRVEAKIHPAGEEEESASAEATAPAHPPVQR
ncbi:MAG: hypothetical protein H7A35_07275 [Planctomycetales bacterium]|nr:hypothetical protein [bacterium]UNM09854.1 MAG: hypothetical protein H7A35_07275 [Planctomycetales bacterium]